MVDLRRNRDIADSLSRLSGQIRELVYASPVTSMVLAPSGTAVSVAIDWLEMQAHVIRQRCDLIELREVLDSLKAPVAL